MVLAAAALVLAAGSALLAPLFFQDERIGALLLGALITADLAVFVLFGRYLVARLVTRPIERLVEATEAVAAGDLARRAPEAPTRELDRLAASVNRMTERVLDAQGALVRAEKLVTVGRLAAGIAHEVGNPLAAVGTYAEVLRRRGADAELVGGIEREAGRIDAIVRSLLAYARPREARRERTSVATVVEGAARLLAAQGVAREVSLEVTAERDVPEVQGDPTALEQVVVNLLLNAIAAVGPGGRIRATVRSRAGAAEIVVEDNGPGVSDEVAGRVFEPFFTTKGPGQGVGLGLAIVQRLVEDHGGRVEVGRAELGGAAFTVRLPVAGA